MSVHYLVFMAIMVRICRFGYTTLSTCLCNLSAYSGLVSLVKSLLPRQALDSYKLWVLHQYFKSSLVQDVYTNVTTVADMLEQKRNLVFFFVVSMKFA